MIDWPERPCNPLTIPGGEGLTVPEAMAGPGGLILFIGMIPLVRLIARWNKPAGILLPAALWVGLSGGILPGLVLLGWVVLGVLFVAQLIGMRQAGQLQSGSAIGLLWFGLTLLVLPLWWWADWSWYGWYDLATEPVGWLDFRTTPLHFLGFSYFYLRLLGWGGHALREPPERIEWMPLICWLAYPPAMRLGPLMDQQDFARAFADWDPRGRLPWGRIAQRFGWLTLGGLCAGVTAHNTRILIQTGNFFAEPEAYSTVALIALLYCMPLLIYLFLWLYNELAAISGLLIGIPVPDNFRWVPLATNLAEFWRRWHVTVSTWLKNNIYKPMGQRFGNVVFATFATFLFCGVWHGAAWSFVLWAVLQTGGLYAQRYWARNMRPAGWENQPVWTLCAWLLTMNFAAVTTAVFLDFEHAGMRILPELIGRAF